MYLKSAKNLPFNKFNMAFLYHLLTELGMANLVNCPFISTLKICLQKRLKQTFLPKSF